LLKLPAPDSPRVTFNELLGVVLAETVSIRVAPSAFIEVAPNLLRDREGRFIESGEYFGCQVLTDYCELDASYVTNKVSDDALAELYFLLAFDLLILNTDRKFGDVLRRDSEPLLVVDHGNALSGANWTAQSLAERHDSGIDVNDRRLISCSLTDENRARCAARRLAAAVADDLLVALASICSYQPLCDAEYKAVANILGHRLESLERLAVDQVQVYAKYLETH